MLKKFLFLAFFVLLVLIITPNSYAQSNGATNSAVPESIDVYAHFWPITAGKTVDDPMYFLKEWKEKIQGVLVFGQSQKAEYAATIATKRILEAEKLYGENKSNVADKTLSLGEKNLNNISDIFDSKPDLSNNSGEIFRKLDNLEKYLLYLTVRKNQKQFQTALVEVQKLISDLRALTSSQNN